jgi:hypothetical protein
LHSFVGVFQQKNKNKDKIITNTQNSTFFSISIHM